MAETDQFFLGQLQTEIANLNKARVKFEDVTERTIIFMTKTSERLKVGAEKFKKHEDVLGDHGKRIDVQEKRDIPKSKTIVALVLGGFTFISLLITLFGYLATNGTDKHASKNYDVHTEGPHENP